MNIAKRKFLILGLIGLLIAGGIFAAAQLQHSGHTATKHKGIYYCPMHPTYTSDHPGDCPICNMKLVKKEESPKVPAQEKSSKPLHDICYLHNCPKVHDGKPCPMMVVAKEGEKIICPICGTHIAGEAAPKKEKKILYWTDPMIPGYKADGPGKSPMGMDLVPVYEEAQGAAASTGASPEGYASILVTPQKQQLIGIKTALVTRKKLDKTIRAVGTIAHDPELYQAQAEYIQAIQAYERAKESQVPEIVDQSKRLVESTKIRLKHMGLSDELINGMAAWKEPEHGLLFAQPGEPVWMYAKVYEYEIPFIHIGQGVMVDVPSLPGETFKGTVRAIDPMVDPTTRTTRIRAQLDDPAGHLKPEMYVNVTLSINLEEALTVSQEAVFNTGTKQIVFVDKGEGLLEPRDVVLGAKTENDYQIQSGLQEGERVVTSGNFLIDSESRLKAALEGMTSGSTPRPQGQNGPEQNGAHQHGQ